MTTITTNRPIDLNGLGFPAVQRWFGDHGEVEADQTEPQLRAAVDAAPDDPTAAREAQDANEVSFIRQRIPAVLTKARAIMADPVNATDFTATERKVILAALLLDLNQRRR